MPVHHYGIFSCWHYCPELVAAILRPLCPISAFSSPESCKRYYEQNKDRFIDKSTDKVLPFDSVHAHIRDYLHARSLQTGINQYITLLTGSANIAGFDLEDM
jgi:hypothetical protein